MSAIDNFIQTNAKWLLILVFTAGVVYSEFQDVKNMEDRLNKKIKIINEHEKEITKLQQDVAVIKAKCPN
tara:strand:+ start:6961 stop:7170 length:210 start_codon:yes stop_codon:yes gene_type:complete